MTRVLILFCLGISISLIGFKYRLRQYQSIPPASTTFDEQGYLWLGKSILTTGIPANWSALDIYQKHASDNETDYKLSGYNISSSISTPSFKNWSTFPKPLFSNIESNIDGYRSQFLFVQPYLDNPPVFGIFLALIDNGTTALISSVGKIRLFPIAISTLTIFLIYLSAYYRYGLLASILASLIYAIGPGYVISGRLALPENFISFLFILTYFLLLSLKNYPILKYPLLLISFLCPLIKLPGLIIPASLFLYFIYQKKYRLSLIILLSAAFGLLCYITYGFYYDRSTFISMLQNQGQRQFLGPISMLVKTIYPQIPFPMFDGWIILGYISILGLLSKKLFTGSVFLLFGILSYFLFFLFFGGNNFPWYQFIIFPLLSLSLGINIAHFFGKIRFYILPVFFTFIFSSLFYYSYIFLEWGKLLNIYRLSIFTFLIIPGIFFLTKKYSILFGKISLLLMLGISFWFSIKIINQMQIVWPILQSKPYPI
jgi:hypothetical protein